VTTDDVIMLLPSFLIPRNLGIGDTFTFKVFGGQKYNNKINYIYDIQKKYTKSIGKWFMIYLNIMVFIMFDFLSVKISIILI